MTKKTEIVTASTDTQSGVTNTFRIPIQPWVFGLSPDERNREASSILAKSSEPLKRIEGQLPDQVGSLFEGQKYSIIIRDGSVYNVINIGGDNAKIYLGSEDRSTNISNVTPDTVFKEIRAIIEANIKQEEERSKLLLKVIELEQTRGSKGFREKYTEFMTLVATHVSVFSPILPALTEWLSRIPQ